MEALIHLVNKLENNIDSKDVFNSQVSQVNVSWHLAHSLKVLHNISKVLQSSNPDDYRWRFNSNRSFVYFINFIPRGKGKAPKAVMPAEDISKEELHKDIATVRQLLNELQHLDAKSNFTHPYFGQLNLKQTKKFLAIHTKHHLKIIDDIIRS
ncbi:MAG: DinB family protein [Flavobacterium sp.]|nr:DinB family protein [Flavobacterium sp.]